MGLDPNYLDSLPDTLVDMYSLVEIDILEDMARRISTYDYFIPAALHQNQKLQELGMVQEHIIQALAAMTGQTQQEIVNLLTEASERAIEDDLEYYTRADVYKPSEVNTEALHKQLNAGLLQTQLAFKNITRTTPNSGGIQFIEALDRAWTQINVGGMDYNTAVNRAIKDLAVHGLNATNSKGKLVKGAIKYNKTGHTDTLEVAVRRAIVTGANQTASKTQEALAEELGADLVEVTAHGGARPEHAKWQGKCFSRNGRKVIDGVVYEDLKKATGYGTGAGLGGWNCSHNFHPYIHGAPHTWTDKELKALEAKNITYNGKKYTEYEASQKQREIERGIRSLKRQVAAIEAGGGDASAERTKLRKAQKGYTDFTEQTGLKKQTARTQTPSVKAEKNVKKAYNTADVNTPTKKEIQQQREQTAENKGLTNTVNNDKMVEEKGLAKASSIFLNKNEKLFRYAPKIKPEEGFEDIVSHANPTAFEIDLVGNGNEKDYISISPRQFAERIRNSNGYHGGDIRLIACRAGEEENGAAQQIANILGCRVKAPTEVVNIDEEGRMFISNNDVLALMWYEAKESEKSKIKETGKWIIFEPQK